MLTYDCCLQQLTDTPKRVWVHLWYPNVTTIISNRNTQKPTVDNFQFDSINPYTFWIELPNSQMAEWQMSQVTTLTRDLTLSGQWTHIPDEYYQWPTNPQLRYILVMELGNDFWIAGWDGGMQASWQTNAFGSTTLELALNNSWGFIKTGEYLKNFIEENTVCDTTCGPYLCETTDSDVRVVVIEDCLVIDFMEAVCE